MSLSKTATDLMVDIIEALTNAVARKSWPRKGKLYVSDVRYGIPIEDDGGCKKQLWAMMRDEPRKVSTPGSDLMLAAGDRLHETIEQWLVDHLKGDWKVTSIEKKVTVDGLAGRLDILLENAGEQIKCVADIKTKRGAAFRYLFNAKVPDKVQVQTYMKGEDADMGLLIYVDREGQNWIKIFPVHRDDNRVHLVTEKIKEIKKKALTGDPVPGVEPILVRKENKGPDSLSVKWPWQAEWCPLQHCYCKARAAKTLPKGIIGYVKNNGDIDLKEEHEDLRGWVESKLEASVDV